MKSHVHLVLFGLGLLIFAGCATPTPADRIASHQAAFLTWPPEVQANVRNGIVAAGYTQEQVWVAYGEPNAKTISGTPGNTYEVWQYHRRAPRMSFAVGGASFGRGGGVAGGVAVNGVKLGEDVGGYVMFRNGLVTEVRITTR
jgi:hypothetical protein